MQDKFIDTGDQLVGDLFADIADETADMAAAAPSQVAIRIVHFDDSDRPADSETRPFAASSRQFSRNAPAISPARRLAV